MGNDANVSKRDGFRSRGGFIIACIGSAVGMGNIWRFPTLVSKWGGMTFLLPYFLFVILIGSTGVIGEFALGRAAGAGPVDAFGMCTEARWGKRRPGELVGYIPVLGSLALAIGYTCVMGWIFKYTFLAFDGGLSAMGQDMDAIVGSFNATASAWGANVWVVVAVAVSFVIMSFGIAGGIEKANKIMMPILFLLFVGLGIYVATLPGASGGYRYIFTIKPAGLLDPYVWIYAFGQAFFSLSVAGNGSVIYGSYLSKSECIPSSARNVALFDTIAALLAAFVIIPAMAAGGAQLDAGGPGLMFIYLVHVMNGMAGGRIVAMVFFVCVAFAGVTSIINLYEAPVASLQERFGLKRVPATAVIHVIGLAVALCIQAIVSQWMDVVSIYICPLGALLAAVMFFWIGGKKLVLESVNLGARKPIGGWYYPLCKYVYCASVLVALVAARPSAASAETMDEKNGPPHMRRAVFCCLFYVFTKCRQDGGGLLARSVALRTQPGGAIAVGRAGDQPERDRVCQRIPRPVGRAATVREAAQVRGCPSTRRLQYPACIFHEQNSELLACHRGLGGEGRRARPGHDAGLIGPEDGILVPVLRQIRKRCGAGGLRSACEIIEDLYDLRACGRALRVEAAAADAGHQPAAHAVVNACMCPVVGRGDIRQVFAGAGGRGDGLRSGRAAARARIAPHTVTRAACLLDDRSAVPHVLAAERAQGLRHGGTASHARVDVLAEVRARQRDVLRDPVIMRVVRAQRCTVPQVEIHVRLDAGDAAAVAVLPCAVAAAVAGLGGPDGEPAVPLVIGRVVQCGRPPVAVGVHADRIARGLQRLAEDGRVAQDLGLRAVVADAAVLQVEVHRQLRVLAVEQAQSVRSLTARLLVGLCERVQIYTVRDAELLACGGVDGPLRVVLRGQVTAAATANDGKVNILRRGVPVDHTLILADIDAGACDPFAGGEYIRRCSVLRRELRGGGAAGQQRAQKQNGKQSFSHNIPPI